MFEDMNWWGVLAMPLGVVICFGPVLAAWALAERSEHAGENSRKESNRR